MINILEKMISRLPHQFKEKPLIEAILYAKARQQEDLYKAQADLESMRWVDAAEGMQLDGCGDIAVLKRMIDKAIAVPFFGFNFQPNITGFNQARLKKHGDIASETTILNDEEYRKYLKLKMFKNTSSAIPEDIMSAFATLFGSEEIVYQEIGNAKIKISVGRELTYNEMYFIKAIKLVIKPAGVGLIYGATFDISSVFGFAYQGYQGFSAGKMARSFSEAIYF